MNQEVYYQTYSITLASLDDYDYVYNKHVKVYTNILNVIKRTEKGVWLDYYGTKKFVRNNAKKKFAYPSKKESLEGFICRKKRQISILNEKIKFAKESLLQTQLLLENEESTKQCTNAQKNNF